MEFGVTLKRIASLLNLSISTVSRALKNHPDISEQTRKKVHETASMLDYEPNMNAISLRTSTRNLIGVIVPEISNFFYHSVINAIDDEARKKQYSLLVLQSGNNPETELDNLRICRSNQVAALFICVSPGTHKIEPFIRFASGGTPVIFFDKVPEFQSCNKISMDDSAIANLAARRILDSGKEKILGLFGDPNLSISKNRLSEFIRQFPADRKPETAFVCSSEEAMKYTLKVLMRKKKTEVIFSMSEEILCGVMKAIHRLRLKIPDEIAVISVSNNDFIPTLFDPEITYIETSGYELGVQLFNRFMEYNKGNTSVQEILIPVRLVEKYSI